MKSKKHTHMVILFAVLLITTFLTACSHGTGRDAANNHVTPPITQTYSLENPTDKQKLERLLSVTLYDDGTATLATPVISSYLLPKCAYAIVGSELQIRSIIENGTAEAAYDVKNGDIIASFEMADNNTLIFLTSIVPMFADEGARYVCAKDTAPKTTPLLDVNLVTVDSNSNSGTQISRDIRAAQLTNDWSVVDEKGDGFSYCADSFHPLQKRDGYGDVTLSLHNSGIVKFMFTDNYPPQSVSVQRWNAEYAGTESTEVWDKGEPVPVNVNTFTAFDDGQDYIYEVYAKWPEGDSWYVFRLDSAMRQNQSGALD